MIRILFIAFIITGWVVQPLYAQNSLSAQPDLSHPAGFYTGAIDLKITSDTENAVIRYTLDGSDPDSDSPVYIDPLSITDRVGDENDLSMISEVSTSYATWAPPMGEVFKGTVVKAAVFQDDERISEIAAGTYFVDPEGHDRYSLPVISIILNRDDFFDHDDGIYVLGRDYEEWRNENPNATPTGGTPSNFHRRGREWEKPMHIVFFEPDGSTGLAQHAGIRIHGSWARAFRQKSLRLYSRSDYGTSRFSYQIFPDNPLDDFNRLILRNSGQDWTSTMFRDAMMQSLVEHMDFDVQSYRPAIVFLNGEYWGIYNIRERYDKHYMETNFGVDRENIDLLTGLRTVKEGDGDHYNAMIDYIKNNDLSEAEHFDYISTQMDVDNFMDYYIAQMYFRNNDWPHNNIDFWRKRTEEYQPDAPYGQDGRWRWLMFDTDFGFGWSWGPLDYDMLEWVLNTDANHHDPDYTIIMRSLIQNTEFRHRFINRFADQLNSAFRPEVVIDRINEMQEVLRPEIEEHIHRWGHHPDRWETPRNMSDWDEEVALLREFAEIRQDAVRKHIRDQFNLNQANMTVDVSRPGAGSVEINSLKINRSTVGVDEEPFPWSGVYFRDVPIKIIATPVTGYRFAGWEGIDENSDTLTVTPTGNLQLTAVFEVDEDALADLFPQTFDLSDSDYHFDRWNADEPAGTYPPGMAFQYMDEDDPGLEAEAIGFTEGVYNLESRTRINGLGAGGFAFINTSNSDGNPGYPGTRLGAAVLALDTRGREELTLSWTGGTVRPNSRVYNLRLQYRIGGDGDFTDVKDDAGNPVEYMRNEQAGHAEEFGPLELPSELAGHPYVQLRWKYYHTGERLDEDSGQRAKLHVSNIHVSSREATSIDQTENLPQEFSLEQNYPNPFNPETLISYQLPVSSDVVLEVYDMLGRRVATLVNEHMPAGQHQAYFDAAHMASGVYLYRLMAGDVVETRKMMLVK